MASSIQWQATLEVLRRKEEEQLALLAKMASELDALHHKMMNEKADVEELESETFKSSLFKMLRIHDGKLTKEQEEYLKAKLDYERQNFMVEDGKRFLKQLQQKIKDAEEQFAKYQENLGERIIEMQILPEGSPQKAVYDRFSEKEKMLKRECVEIEEAMHACKQVFISKCEAMDQLLSADDLATWDTWAGGGLLVDMAKYDELEGAEVKISQINSDIRHLERELADIGMIFELNIENVDASVNVFDLWFDNIFSDYQSKEQISSQIKNLNLLNQQLIQLEDTLIQKHEIASSELKAATEALESILMEDELQ